MALKDELIEFLNNHVKEYETDLFVMEDDCRRPMIKEEVTLFVVGQLLNILDEYNP